MHLACVYSSGSSLHTYISAAHTRMHVEVWVKVYHRSVLQVHLTDRRSETTIYPRVFRQTHQLHQVAISMTKVRFLLCPHVSARNACHEKSGRFVGRPCLHFIVRALPLRTPRTLERVCRSGIC